MTNEIIDKYLDTQGITTGEWLSYSKGVETDEIMQTNVRHICTVPSDYDGTENDLQLIANSRKSLRDWIMIALDFQPLYNTCSDRIDRAYERAIENIERSLSKPWSQVREELERMEG